jgi:hypothetical protein
MKSIVFCTSQRFKKDLAEFIAALRRLAEERRAHLVILEPNFDDRPEEFCSLPESERLKDSSYRATVAGMVYDHLFRKVNVADVCFIFNKNGYIGANTNGELFAAAVAGKMIYALEDKILMGEYPHKLYEEPSSRKLIHEVVKTPEELFHRLA